MTMIIELTDKEASELYSLLLRNTDNHNSIQLTREKDHQVLWDFECLLKNQMPPDWEEL